MGKKDKHPPAVFEPPAESIQQPFLDVAAAKATEWRARMQHRLRGGVVRHHSPPVEKLDYKPRLLLVIGDAHAHPDFNRYRFDWLGRMITDLRPHTVVDIGDSADMPSLFGYEKGNNGPLFEGRAYWQDVEAYVESRERMKAQLDSFFRGRHKSELPALIRLLGNHENRIDRVIAEEPRFAGVISTADLLDVEFGWTVVPFLEPIDVEGISFCHYFRSPGSGDRPISGIMPTRAVAMKRHRTSVFGHTHRIGWHEEHDGYGGRISVINCGMFAERAQNLQQKWARDDVDAWREGILTLSVLDGRVESARWYTMEEIKARYA